jgi:TPR repeat protein
MRLPFAYVALLSLLAGWFPEIASAKQRLAFIVGVGNYDTKSGLPVLNAPANDTADVKAALERLPQPFSVEILTDDQAKDKDTFQAAFDHFVNRIDSGDEILFYFSGHGFSVAQNKQNYFLLKNAKSETAFLKDLSPADQRELDSPDKKTKKYSEFITSVALSEGDIEKAIADRKPNVIILIADACRSLIEGTKGASLDGVGIVLPAHSAFGTYRLYSASAGQVSYESLEPVSLPEGIAGYKPRNDKGSSKKDKKNSLFTRVLINELLVPGQPILILAAQVKRNVRQQARTLNKDQIPDYNEDITSNDYFFWPSEDDNEVSALCQSANAKLENLRSGIASGSLGRDTIAENVAELSRCGSRIREELRSLSRIEAQGTGAFASDSKQIIDTSTITDPQKLCDIKGTSPLDSDRPQGLAGTDIQKLAVAAISPEGRKKPEAEIKSIIEVCEEAVKQRPRVARFKFNAATAHYALAGITTGIERTVALWKSSLFNQEAVDLGYAAAYNSLAVMIQNGEYYQEDAESPLPADRDKALALLKQGADLGHVVAQYNLGMAYLAGDLGLGKITELANVTDTKLVNQKRQAVAFKWLSAAAEKSYVPAMIEYARLLHDGIGVSEANPARAIYLLEVAASSGSWEAMFWLGEIYRRGRGSNQGDRDYQQAILWYARAAEAGDVRSQQHLAQMLRDGDGIPAPQPEAAGRYFRLAAYAGSGQAQAELGDLLREKKIPFRPVADRKPDGGALEIRTLYLAAFASGNPKAGVTLAKLYRSGFPTEQGSEAIPKDPESAVNLLYRTIERVKEAAAESSAADPRTSALAAFELISMYDKGEAVRRDGSAILTADQVRLLREEYGSGNNLGWIRASAIGPISCGSLNDWSKITLMVWDWDRDEPPTEAQLKWLERYNNCAEEAVKYAQENKQREPRPEDTGFTREYRNRILQQFKAAREDAKRNAATAKSFYDRMAELVNKPNGRWR